MNRTLLKGVVTLAVATGAPKRAQLSWQELGPLPPALFDCGVSRIPPHSPRFAHTAPRDGAVRPRASATSFEPLSEAELGLPECELDAQGRERVTLQAEGWRRWEWRGHACNYIAAGEANTGPIVVLVHGFGAHSYHWRYTIPALARKGFRVYALCMLGYGWSPKVEAEFSMELWGQQGGGADPQALK